MRLTWHRSLAGVAFVATAAPCLVLAQPSAAGAPAPVAIEVEEDVEVVATPEPARAGASGAAAPEPADSQAPVPVSAPGPAGAPGSAAATPSAAALAAPAGSQPASSEATPASAAPQPSAASGVAASAIAPDAAAQAARIAALEARLAALESKPTEPNPPATAAASDGAASEDAQDSRTGVVDPWLGIQWSAWVQAQYESNQLSEDQLMPGGGLQNHNRFLIRRARLRMQRTWDYAGIDVEFDANTLNGLTVGMRRAAGSVFWPAPDPKQIPYLRAQAGMIDIPFGYELPSGARERIFGERSVASLAFFPWESDVGAALDGGIGPLRYALAILNGFEAGADYRWRDPNAPKDLLLRVGVDVPVSQNFRVDGGVSFLDGSGFHRGSPATKNTLQWNDINEDGLKTDAEVSGLPGTAATPSENFDRWALALDARVSIKNPLGWLLFAAEMTVAQNLDRGLFVADPIASSMPSRELGYYAAFTQEITPYFLVGFRTDFYDGNSDFIERRRGRTFREPQTIRRYSPVVGLVLPGYARLTFEYNIVRDKLGRDGRGEPADLKNNLWTVQLQVGL